MESVSWFDALRRRWAELLRWISRARTRPAQTALPARLSEETGATPSSGFSSEMQAPVVAQVPPATPVEPAAAIAAVVTPVAAVSGPAEGLREVGYAGLSVRLYFNRLLAATPEGLSVDFTRWQTASVERFFLAMTSPGLVRRREAPTTGDERLTLPTAFEGFEWD